MRKIVGGNQIVRGTILVLTDPSGPVTGEHRNDLPEQKAQPQKQKRSKTLRYNLRKLCRNKRQVECTTERVHCGPRKMILSDQYRDTGK